MSRRPKAQPELLPLSPEQRDEALRKADRLQRLLIHAIGTGTTLAVEYGMSRAPTVSDLAAMEKALNGWVTGTLRMLGCKLPRGRIFGFDLEQLEHKDDGENKVTIRLDFSKLVPGERPPELLEVCEKLIAEDDEEVELAAAPPPGEGA